MIRFAWGETRVTLIDGGSVWLDGGAMFGVVPRPLWERQREPDARHRIRLALNLLLVEDGTDVTLVDTGAGADWDERSVDVLGIEPRDAADLLRPAGVAPGDVTRVVLTHLHFDHAGGGVAVGADGERRAAFPNARYVVQRGELEQARLQDNERIRAAFEPRHFEPLAAEPGRLQLLEGETALPGGLRLLPAPGHTPNMQIVILEGGPAPLAFMADLVPTASHVPYGWIMGFDQEPMVTLATKKSILPRALDEGWRLVFEHDWRMPLATLATDERGRVAARAWEPGG